MVLFVRKVSKNRLPSEEGGSKTMPTNRIASEDQCCFLSTAQVATRYGVSKLTTRRLFVSGKIPMPIRVGRQLRWRLSDLLKFEESQSKSHQLVEAE